jgi:2',3'-cyclic-nucleotide 2'-phosphodiesterase/3'-nucleotidase
MIAAMNALGFDAGTLGNHEFNYGLPALRRALAGAAFPVVAANVRAGEGLLAPASTILERRVPGPTRSGRPLRVGLLGVAPPQIAVWDRRILGSDVFTRDILEAAREEVPRLRASGADLVVALCHSGLGHEAPEPLMENAAVPLAAIPGLDAVVVGHSHEVFPGGNRTATAAVDPAAGTIHGVPAVQPGAHGSHVGVIDIALRWRGEAGGEERGPWDVAGARARVIRVTPLGTPEAAIPARADPGLAALAAPLHAHLLRAASEPVGETLVPLHSYLALVAGGAALDVVADAQRAHTRRILSGTGVEGLPVLAAVAPFRAGGRSGVGNYVDVRPGPVALRQAAGLYVFPNGVAVVEITGAGLRDWLERGASMFRTLVPGVADQPLIDPAFPSYNFETIDGLEWVVDPTRPPRTDADGRVFDRGASRILELCHEGRPVEDGDRFALATNSYRLATGGAFAAAQGARRLHESPRQVRDVVIAHIRASPVNPAPRLRWRFAALPGTAAWFDTGPGALAHLASADGRVIEDLGPAPDGFRRLRLRF